MEVIFSVLRFVVPLVERVFVVATKVVVELLMNLVVNIILLVKVDVDLVAVANKLVVLVLVFRVFVDVFAVTAVVWLTFKVGGGRE